MNKRQKKKLIKKYSPVTKYAVEYKGPLPDGFRSVTGTLEFFHETGMECIACVIYDNSNDKINPNHDPSKPEDYTNVKKYKSLLNAHFIRRHDIIELDGKRYVLLNDPTMMTETPYQLSIYPMGFDINKWIIMLNKENKRATIYTKSKKIEI